MKSIEGERIALLECGKPKRRQIDREGITRRWEHGYTQQEIADAVKCSTATVRKVLRQEGYEEEYSGQGWSCKVMRRERIMEIIERPDEEQKEPEKNDIFRTAAGEPDHDMIYWLQNS